MATYPPRGSTPWDNSLRNYIDAGDAEAQTAAEATAADALAAHTSDTDNPHEVTAAQVPYAGGARLPSGSVEGALDALDSRWLGTTLAGPPDADTLTSPGSYYFGTSGATTALNWPSDGFQGLVRVGTNTVGNVIWQEATQTIFVAGAVAASSWVRSKHGILAWTPWRLMTDTITGTGMPNDVVAAPVGTRYVDTAATNGAREWYKDSGTGTTGWIVTNGDTGWRDISSTIDPAFWTVEGASASAFKVRRVGDSIRVQVRLKPAAAVIGTAIVSTPVMTLPAGFSCDGYIPVGLAMVQSSRAAGVLHTQVGVTSLNFAPDDSHNGKTWASTHLFVASASFFTSVAWPTSLPGTPA